MGGLQSVALAKDGFDPAFLLRTRLPSTLCPPFCDCLTESREASHRGRVASAPGFRIGKKGSGSARGFSVNRQFPALEGGR